MSGANGEWVSLPSDGYDGPLPEWPLMNEPSDYESVLWRDTWRLPQAVMWADKGLDRVVARYVMACAIVEMETTAGMMSEIRQLEDRLGLSPMALKKLQWIIAEPSSGEVAEVTRIDRYADL